MLNPTLLKKLARHGMQLDHANPAASRMVEALNGISPDEMSSEDHAKFQDLGGEINRGVNGLDYLTGAKKMEEQTYFDDHPIKSTLLDASKYAPAAAGVLGAGYLGHKAYKSHKLHNVELPAERQAWGGEHFGKSEAKFMNRPDIKAETANVPAFKKFREEAVKYKGGTHNPEHFTHHGELARKQTPLMQHYVKSLHAGGKNPRHPATPEAQAELAKHHDQLGALDHTLEQGATRDRQSAAVGRAMSPKTLSTLEEYAREGGDISNRLSHA